MSKSLEVGKGVWPMNMSTQGYRRGSLQTTSLTSPAINIPVKFPSNNFGGSGSAGGGTPTEKECRQVFFDCAL